MVERIDLGDAGEAFLAAAGELQQLARYESFVGVVGNADLDGRPAIAQMAEVDSFMTAYTRFGCNALVLHPTHTEGSVSMPGDVPPNYSHQQQADAEATRRAQEAQREAAKQQERMERQRREQAMAEEAARRAQQQSGQGR